MSARYFELWRTWDESDMPQSDVFFAKHSEAMKHLREAYGVTATMLQQYGAGMKWRADADGYIVHLEAVSIGRNAEDIATALTFLPHR